MKVLATLIFTALATPALAAEYALTIADLIHPCTRPENQDFQEIEKATGMKMDQMPFQIVATGSCQDASQVMDVYAMNGGNVKVDEKLKLQKFPTMDACKKALEPAVVKAFDGVVDECKALCSKNKRAWTVDAKTAEMYAKRGGWSDSGTGVYASSSLQKEIMGVCK